MWSFKRKPKLNKPEEYKAYMVTNGNYKGTLVLFFDLEKMPIDDIYYTFAVGDEPDAYGGMRIFEIPATAIDEAFKNKIIICAGKVPKKKWDILHLEYKERMMIHQKETEKDCEIPNND